MTGERKGYANLDTVGYSMAICAIKVPLRQTDLVLTANSHSVIGCNS